jgi:hypothetical protein
VIRTVARAFVAAATLATALVAVAPAASASAPAPCPGGESPCVYLAGGSYVLGNPVATSTGIAPSSTVLLKHSNSTGTDCDYTTLNLPGFTITSTPSTVLTLNVPGEGVGLSGITPVVYLGVPGATPGGTKLGLTLTVSGTAFVLFDSSLAPAIACGPGIAIPPTTFLSGTIGVCSFTFTVSL